MEDVPGIFGDTLRILRLEVAGQMVGSDDGHRLSAQHRRAFYGRVAVASSERPKTPSSARPSNPSTIFAMTAPMLRSLAFPSPRAFATASGTRPDLVRIATTPAHPAGTSSQLFAEYCQAQLRDRASASFLAANPASR